MPDRTRQSGDASQAGPPRSPRSPRPSAQSCCDSHPPTPRGDGDKGGNAEAPGPSGMAQLRLPSLIINLRAQSLSAMSGSMSCRSAFSCSRSEFGDGHNSFDSHAGERATVENVAVRDQSVYSLTELRQELESALDTISMSSSHIPLDRRQLSYSGPSKDHSGSSSSSGPEQEHAIPAESVMCFKAGRRGWGRRPVRLADVVQRPVRGQFKIWIEDEPAEGEKGQAGQGRSQSQPRMNAGLRLRLRLWRRGSTFGWLFPAAAPV